MKLNKGYRSWLESQRGKRFSVEAAWVYYGIVFVAKWFQGLIWEGGEEKEP